MTDPAQILRADDADLHAQRAALAVARERIIERYRHIETVWLKQPALDDTIANWGGMVQGLREARMIIGRMWDELPVPKQSSEVEEILGMDTIP